MHVSWQLQLLIHLVKTSGHYLIGRRDCGAAAAREPPSSREGETDAGAMEERLIEVATMVRRGTKTVGRVVTDSLYVSSRQAFKVFNVLNVNDAVDLDVLSELEDYMKMISDKGMDWEKSSLTF